MQGEGRGDPGSSQLYTKGEIEPEAHTNNEPLSATENRKLLKYTLIQGVSYNI